MKTLGLRIAVRWLVNSFGLWLGAELIPGISYQDRLGVIIAAGLVLSFINVLIKPLVIILSLPALLFSLGLFMIVINGFMVYLVSKLVDSFYIESFGSAILAGLIIGLVNYAVTTLLEERKILRA